MDVYNNEQVDALLFAKSITGIPEQFNVKATFQLTDGRYVQDGDTLNISNNNVNWSQEQLEIIYYELSKMFADVPERENPLGQNPFI